MSLVLFLACGAAGQSFTDPADVPLLTEHTASFVVTAARDLVLGGGAIIQSAPLTSLRSGSPGQHSTAAISVPLSPGTTLTGLSFAYRYDTGYGHAGDGKAGANFTVSVVSTAAGGTTGTSTPLYRSPHLVDFSYDADRTNYSAPVAVDAAGLSIPIARYVRHTQHSYLRTNYSPATSPRDSRSPSPRTAAAAPRRRRASSSPSTATSATSSCCCRSC